MAFEGREPNQIAFQGKRGNAIANRFLSFGCGPSLSSGGSFLGDVARLAENDPRGHRYSPESFLFIAIPQPTSSYFLGVGGKR
jgi:hypothetical protein